MLECAQLTEHDTTPTAERAELALVLGSLLVLFTYVFLANSWIGDDAYITFRVVDNFVNGYGLTFNPDERVQAYTHPLWMFLLSLAYLVTSDLFYTTVALSYLLCVLAIAVAIRSFHSVLGGALFLGVLISSKAFVDYTSSGLEYPLSFLLLSVFYVRFFRVMRKASVVSPAEIVVLSGVAALAFLNRSDSILLYVGPLAYLGFITWPLYRFRLARYFAVGLCPIALWLAFSYVYYGFPFPNTYYAKVATGIPRGVQLRQGLAYVANSINFDPFTLGVIGLTAVVATVARRAPDMAALASALLYVLYTISVGGDFMSGRFFAMPLLVAAMVLTPMIQRRHAAITAGVVLMLYNIIAPLAPLKTRANYPDGAWPWRLQNGIKDERGHYHYFTNVLFYAPMKAIPDHLWYRQGISFRNSTERVSVQGSIGFFGFTAGPTKYVIDRNALSDPLLARLPVSESLYFEFYAGHFFRELPGGYIESRRERRNLIADPALHEYYDKLLNVVSGPIFSSDRFRDIWELNAGRYRRLHDLVRARRRVSVSIAADNERFLTDVGTRNTRGEGALIASGREGYLQMGPHIPLKAGRYTVRWVGTTEAGVGEPLGFVDVWDADRMLARRSIFQGEFPGGEKLLAEISFELKEPARSLEYRFYVQNGVKLVLERINLESE
jgi:arabinofuranosyltransferase